SKAASLRQLQKLDIPNQRLHDSGASTLLHSKWFATLTDINFSDNGLTDDTLGAIASATALKLTALDLSQNRLSGSGLSALNAKHLSGLERLDVAMNGQLGRVGAENLARAPFAARLRALNLANCDFDDAAGAALLGADWPQLVELNLALNGF